MESLGIRCFVEIEISSEYLICSLTGEYHLDTHTADDSCQQIHRGRCSNGCHIVGLDEIDDITDGIQTFLYGIVDFMMHGTDVLCYEASLSKVWCTFQSYSKGVQTWPVSLGLFTILNTISTVFLCDGRDDR